MADPRDEAATEFEEIADQLDRAAEHARVAAKHYRNREIAPAGAHTTALYGHLENANSLLRKRVRVAASFALNSYDNPEEAERP